jgi:hypothetical protein
MNSACEDGRITSGKNEHTDGTVGRASPKNSNDGMSVYT